MEQSKINQLVIQAKNNDPIAFAELIGCTQRFAYCVAFRITGNAEESRDIVQEAYIRVWANLHRFSGKVTFQSWFFAILHHLSIDWIRKQKAQQPIDWQKFEDTDNNHPGAIYESNELESLIRSWMVSLPEIQQMVFMLRDLEDLSIKEVQEQTGLTESSIKSNLWVARKKLADYLKKRGYPLP